MAVRIRLKKFGRRHRPYFRICVMDARTPRDGKTIEEIGTYDPLIRDTDKRCTIRADRADYWLSVGAKPTEKVKALLDKYKGKVAEKRIDAPRSVTIPAPKPILARPKSTPEPTLEPEAEAAPPPAETEPESASAAEPATEG